MRASTPLCGSEARFLYAALFRQWLSVPDIGRYRSSWSFEGNFTNCNSEPFVASTRTEAIYLFLLPRHGLHGVYAPLCHRVITSRWRYVFGLAVGVHRQICLAGYAGYDFAETFQRALLVNHARNTL